MERFNEYAVPYADFARLQQDTQLMYYLNA